MGRTIQGSALQRDPQVKFTREGTPDAKAGSYFIGQKTGERAVDKHNTVFEFLLEYASDTTPILMKQEDKSWIDAPVGPGSKVCMFGSTSAEGVKNQILDKLQQVAIGERVKVMFNGKQPSKKAGRSYNDFLVKILNPDEKE